MRVLSVLLCLWYCSARIPRGRRLIAGVPSVREPILVPCNSSDVCYHGKCRNSHCLCDNGWYTETASSPCGAEAKSQLTMAVLQYLFGYLGVVPFVLGWTSWGVASLMLLLCFCMFSVLTAHAMKKDTQSICDCFYLTCKATTGCALLIVWIIMAVAVSTSCVDENGVKCKSW